MRMSRSSTSVAVTLIVGLATLFALAHPEGVGGRDSVVRLTRLGTHRTDCADAASHDHGDPEACLAPATDLVPDSNHVGGTPHLVLTVAAAPALPVPTWHDVAPTWPTRHTPPPAPPGHAVSGRAPPAL